MLLVGTVDTKMEIVEIDRIMRNFVIACQFRNIGKKAYMQNMIKVLNNKHRRG